MGDPFLEDLQTRFEACRKWEYYVAPLELG